VGLVGNPTAEPRYALGFALLSSARHRITSLAADVPASGARTIRLGLPALRRGRLACPRIRVETRFPIGLWQAWAYYTPPLTAIVISCGFGEKFATVSRACSASAPKVSRRSVKEPSA